MSESLDKLGRYLDTRADFEAKDQALADFASYLARIALKLETGRGSFLFKGAAYEPRHFRRELMHDAASAGSWMTPEEIMRALDEWHAAKDAMWAAWKELTPAHQKGAQRPLSPIAKRQDR